MNTIEMGMAYVMNTYNRFPIVLEKGEGMYVYDDNGKKYLDFVAGIAVNSLGHNNPVLVDAITEQAKKLIHVSNLYWTKPQIDLAKKLVENSCFSKAFFCNSGAESIEGAIKLVRKYAKYKGTNRYKIIAMEHSFHGRTYAAVSATGQKKYQEGLEPLHPGFVHVPFNDLKALASAIDDQTCAVLLEPLQGEGGIHPADQAYLEGVRQLCDQHGLCLVFDEIQCGVGRMGSLFAYQHYGVEPDIAVIAKGTAGGVPIGVLLAKEEVAKGFKPGDHASTFGGNPLAAAAGNAVIGALLGGLLENVKETGAYLSEKLQALQEKHPVIKDIRGIGLMQGIELTVPVGDIVAGCMDNGLLLVNAGTNIIRFVPALITGKAHIDEAMDILDKVLENS